MYIIYATASILFTSGKSATIRTQLSLGLKALSFFLSYNTHTQGAEVTGQLRVNGKLRHLRRCTLEDKSLVLKRKHRVHKYVNTAAICVSVMNLFILT